MKFAAHIFSLTMGLLFVASANAESPIIPQGSFHVASVQVSKVKRFERVYVGTAAGNSRLQDLRALKYSCKAQTAQIFECSKFSQDLSLPASVAEQINSGIAGYKVSFQEQVGAPELENDAEVLQEWSVSQKVQIGSRIFKRYRYQIVQGLHKITPLVEDDVMEPMTLVVENENTLREPRTYQSHETATSWSLYFVSVNLTK